MNTVVKGNAWTFGDNINTESIMRSGADWSAELAVPTCLTFYDPDFSKSVQKGDMIVAGKNFGNSSSRPAAEVLVFLGVSCIICDSCSRIFFRNTWNIGIPVLECPGITGMVSKGDKLEANIETGEIKNLTTGAVVQADSPIPLLVDRWRAGGMMEYVKQHKEDYPGLE